MSKIYVEVAFSVKEIEDIIRDYTFNLSTEDYAKFVMKHVKEIHAWHNYDTHPLFKYVNQQNKKQ